MGPGGFIGTDWSVLCWFKGSVHTEASTKCAVSCHPSALSMLTPGDLSNFQDLSSYRLLCHILDPRSETLNSEFCNLAAAAGADICAQP